MEINNNPNNIEFTKKPSKSSIIKEFFIDGKLKWRIFFIFVFYVSFVVVEKILTKIMPIFSDSLGVYSISVFSLLVIIFVAGGFIRLALNYLNFNTKEKIKYFYKFLSAWAVGLFVGVILTFLLVPEWPKYRPFLSAPAIKTLTVCPKYFLLLAKAVFLNIAISSSSRFFFSFFATLSVIFSAAVPGRGLYWAI